MPNEGERFTAQIIDSDNTARAVTLTIAGMTEIRARNASGRVASALNMDVAHFYAAEPPERGRSPLTPDERAEAVAMLRERGDSVLHPDPRAHALADRLEAEPQRDRDARSLDHLYREVIPSYRSEIERLLRERDEAREALRERNAEVQRLHALMDDQPARMALAGLIDALGEEDPDDDLIREAVDRGIAALVGEGVERTHTLVPNAVLEQIAPVVSGERAVAFLEDRTADGERWRAIERAVAGSARGESVAWPATEDETR